MYTLLLYSIYNVYIVYRDTAVTTSNSSIIARILLLVSFGVQLLFFCLVCTAVCTSPARITPFVLFDSLLPRPNWCAVAYATGWCCLRWLKKPLVPVPQTPAPRSPDAYLKRAPHTKVRAGSAPTAGSFLSTMHFTFLPSASGGSNICMKLQTPDVRFFLPWPAPTATAVCAVVPSAATAGAAGGTVGAAGCGAPEELLSLGSAGEGWVPAAAGVPPSVEDMLVCNINDSSVLLYDAVAVLHSVYILYCIFYIYIHIILYIVHGHPCPLPLFQQ